MVVELLVPGSATIEDSRLHVTRVDFANGDVFPMHTHEDGQFAYAKCGAISMVTQRGRWVVPSRRAVWVPSDVPHEMHMRGAVTLINTFVDECAARHAGLPPQCHVFAISTLLQHLFDAALELDAARGSSRHERVAGLLLDEMRSATPLPLAAPLPADARLAQACRGMLERPAREVSIDHMAAMASMSRRTFTRRFRAGTGMSFVAWRQQVCLMEGLSRLCNGASVTEVAVELGYSSPSAFTKAFRDTFGHAPRHYLRRRD